MGTTYTNGVAGRTPPPPFMTDAELQEALSKVPRSVAVGKDSVDMVNQPPHYRQHPSGVEAITVVEWFTFNLGNCIKYIWRAGLKGEKLEDLKKAQYYLNREIQRLEGINVGDEVG